MLELFRIIKETGGALKYNWKTMVLFHKIIWMLLFPVAFLSLMIFVFLKRLVEKRSKEKGSS